MGQLKNGGWAVGAARSLQRETGVGAGAVLQGRDRMPERRGQLVQTMREVRYEFANEGDQSFRLCRSCRPVQVPTCPGHSVVAVRGRISMSFTQHSFAADTP